MFDLAIIGQGPVGSLLAYRACQQGYSVLVYDTHSPASWKHTLGVWTEDIPSWLSPKNYTSLQVGVRFRAEKSFPRNKYYHPTKTTLEHILPQTYAIINNQTLHNHLNQHYKIYANKNLYEYRKSKATVSLALHNARYAIDTTGAVPTQTDIYQIGYGITVPMHYSDQLLPCGTRSGWLMDWSQSYNDDFSLPSFAYIMPYNSHEILIEETILVSPLPIPTTQLKNRLTQRLIHKKVLLPHQSLDHITHSSEKVYFSTRSKNLHVFGAGGMCMNPATGYSVGASLSYIDTLLEQCSCPSPVSIFIHQSLSHSSHQNSHLDTNKNTKLNKNNYAPSLPLLVRLIQFLRLWCTYTEIGLEKKLPIFLSYFFLLPPQDQHNFLTHWQSAPTLISNMRKIFFQLPLSMKIRSLLAPLRSYFRYRKTR